MTLVISLLFIRNLFGKDSKGNSSNIIVGDSGLGSEVGEGRGENIRAPVASLKGSEVVSGHAAIVGSAPSAAGLVDAIGGVSENVAIDNDFIQLGTSVIVISGRRDLK